MTTLTYILSVLKTTGGAVKLGALVWKAVDYLPSILGERVNPLALPDEDFMFLHNRFLASSGRSYYPTTGEEVQNCKSLCNSGVLRHVGDGYKLTWANRHMVKKHNKWLLPDASSLALRCAAKPWR